ncbi:Peptidase family M23 [Cognatiyoonia koreensis]|uniref:Peptidase family M23 n=1 Tax=Cognatiyoonia koreensis TaxID=364200 RepID=A0A1I0MWK4_9RHOB|nr:M23 family metallopeptidase [Cognatiyoonia koreensis]SEV92762.1 Peptidase family M23 [Cognatiyoonia koreensis]
MRLCTAVILSLAATPVAGEFSLELPIDCILDDTCHIQQFVDRDPTSGASDFQCGSLTYDGHKGTDFALPSLAAQAEGVAVLAAAPGRVVGVRNDMLDALQNGPDAPDITDRECGNGVVIRHDDGWETQYCHMAQGSVTVIQNQIVAAGDTLGMVGLSGQTQFPHLHLSVRKNGDVVDPFDPDNSARCGPATQTLWAQTIETPAGGLITSGFSASVPEFAAIKAGAVGATELAAQDPIVIWTYAFGSKPGDTLTLSITGPEGEVIRETVILDRTQAQLFRAIGRRAPVGGWPAGDYEGQVLHERGETLLDTQSTSVVVR